MLVYLLILQKKMKFIIPLTLLICVACNESATENATAIVNAEDSALSKRKIVSNYQCVAKVNGLVCKMGCGGAIRKGLTALEGVNRVIVDYDENREEQIVTVLYNSSLQNEKDIFSTIETLNKGQFTLGDTKSEAIQNPS